MDYSIQKTAAFLVLSVLLFSSCKKSKTEEKTIVPESQPTQNNFTRQVMLANFSDNLILPSLLAFHQQADSLYVEALSFTHTPNQATLDTLQSRLDKTFLAWQFCGWFRYGSARTQFGAVDGAKRMDEINTFPVSATKTEAYITAADYTLSNTDYDTRGLGAIDYLINPLDGKDSMVLANFNQSNNRKEYLKAVTFSIKTRANAVNTAWPSEKIDYVASIGTDASSSTSSTLLDLDLDCDNATNYKVGIPVGRFQAGQTLPALPDQTEAYYGGYSVKYLRANINAIENVWLGRSIANVNGPGFDDYLNAMNAGSVAQNIIQQFDTIYAKLDALPQGRLSDIIKSNKQPVQELYSEMQKLNRYLNTDMISVLGLSIIYSSGDGD